MHLRAMVSIDRCREYVYSTLQYFQCSELEFGRWIWGIDADMKQNYTINTGYLKKIWLFVIIYGDTADLYKMFVFLDWFLWFCLTIPKSLLGDFQLATVRYLVSRYQVSSSIQILISLKLSTTCHPVAIL